MPPAPLFAHLLFGIFRLPSPSPRINDAFRIQLMIRVLMDLMEMYRCAHPLSNGQRFRLSCTAPTRTSGPANLRAPLPPRKPS